MKIKNLATVKHGQLKEALNVLTTAPTSDNTDGTIKIVYLETEPTNKYNGYIYLIKE